jgi:hypothetical protein
MTEIRHMRILLVSRTHVLMGLMAAVLAGCASKVPVPLPLPQSGGDTRPTTAPAIDMGAKEPPMTAKPLPPKVDTKPVAPKVSQAATALAYRKDAASHLYERNQHRIYPGTLPPLLYAIGVLNVEIDRRGNVVSTAWQRAPRHAPEVMAEIIRTVEAAAPYPLPSKLGRLTYTDTWLWDESGRFQLDTLTEGQR